jgi:hypothetical protein
MTFATVDGVVQKRGFDQQKHADAGEVDVATGMPVCWKQLVVGSISDMQGGWQHYFE